MSAQALQHWKEIRFKDFVKLQRGFDLPRQNRKDGKYPVIASTSITGYHDEYKVEPPCVTTGRSGALGEVLYVKERCWPLNTALWVKDFKGNDPYFVFSLLKTLHLEQYNSGAGVPTLNRNHLDQIKVELPPITDQRMIADVLSTYDDLIENNARRIKILEQMTQTIYTEWFVKFLFPDHEKVKMVDSGADFGKIPEGWAVKKLGDICTRIQAGGTPLRGKSEYWDNGEIDWYTTGELHDNFLFSSAEKITKRAIEETSAKIFDRGTILMAIYGSPTVGRLGITTQRSSCNQAALGLVGDPDFVAQTYLFYTLKSLRERFNLEAVGAAQQNISKIKVAETNCLLAPIRLVSQFDGYASAIFQELENIQKQNSILRQLRNLLLPKLVTGEIKV